MMKIIYFFFFLLTINSTFSQITNVRVGLWSDATTWSNNIIPSVNDTVSLNYDLTIDINGICKIFHANGHNITIADGVTLNVWGNNDVAIDIDGNIYPVVRIGTQVWMQKNLDVSHYRNGDTIPEVKDTVGWAGLTTGAWCNFGNDTAYGTVYGKLYNWYAVNDPRGLAPAGWHVSTENEWFNLIFDVGIDAGNRLKEAGSAHWFSPNTGVDNISGFTALPGGYRVEDGFFEDIRNIGNWWTSTQTADFGISSHLYRSASVLVYRQMSQKVEGFSVRCVRD